MMCKDSPLVTFMILLWIRRGRVVSIFLSEMELLSHHVDMLLAATSLLIAAAFNPLKVARQIWPHIAVLGLFVTFVIWNGGVVLGS